MNNVNFLPWRSDFLSRKKRFFYLSISATTLFFILTALNIHSHESKAINQLKKTNAHYKHQIKPKKFFEKHQDELQQKKQIIQSKTSDLKLFNLSSTTKTLYEIPIKTPSNIYLESIKKEKHTLEIQGRAPSYKDITKLEKNLNNIKGLRSETLTVLENKKQGFAFSLQIKEEMYE